LIAELLSELIDADQLFEHQVPRQGKRPKILLSREPQTSQNPLPLDLYSRNSHGHYLAPAVPKAAAKTL
jgi:hypothetical protein